MYYLSPFFTNYKKTKPIYTDIYKLPYYADTVIIGAGCLGLSAALELSKAGQSVVVLEAKMIEESASSRSGGQLWPGLEMTFTDMRNKYGNTADAIWMLMHDALKNIHTVLKTNEDRCDFSPGTLILSKTPNQSNWIKKEIKAIQDAGIPYAFYIPNE